MQKLLFCLVINLKTSFPIFETVRIAQILSNFNGYGCWCYFGENSYGKGKSQPVDGLDSLCKSLHQGYECAIIDSREEDNDFDCKSYDLIYTPISPTLDDDQIFRACELANSGTEEVRSF